MTKKTLIGIWALVIAMALVSRCNPTLLYRSTSVEYLLAISSTLVVIILDYDIVKLRRPLVSDLFFLLTIIFFFTSKTLTKVLFYFAICILFYYVIQRHPRQIELIQYPIIGFSILTAIVTWISFVSPNYYINNILTLFPEGSSLRYSFLYRNMYHGFTNHYSRNSYYITVGILLLYSAMLSGRRSKLKLATTLFLLCTEFLVAKRGLTLFLLMVLILVTVVKEPGYSEKILKSIKFMIVGIGLFVLIYMFVPGVDNIINRIVSSGGSSDVSSGRFYLWRVAWEMFLDHPIIGNGWGSYLKAMAGTTFQGAHNDYLQFLAETGAVGFMINMIADFSSLYYSSKAFKLLRENKYRGTLEQKWIIFSYSMQVFILLYSLTGMPHYAYEQYGLYLMMCGVSVGLYKQYAFSIDKPRKFKIGIENSGKF